MQNHPRRSLPPPSNLLRVPLHNNQPHHSLRAFITRLDLHKHNRIRLLRGKKTARAERLPKLIAKLTKV